MTLGEVILYVDDMASQVRFYRDIVGLPVDWPNQADYSGEHWVTFKTGACKLALHAGGRPAPGDCCPVKFVFMVDKLDEARQRLIKNGVRLSGVRSPAPGVLVCDALDPEGNAFSLEASL